MKKFMMFLVVAVGGVMGVLGVGGFGDLASAVGGDVDVGVDVGVGVGADVDIGAEVVQPEIFIKAVNPGYTVDGVSNVGEMIEIGKRGEEVVSLDEVSVWYVNASGNEVMLVEFSEYDEMRGDLVLRLASSSETAHRTYAKTLALKAGPLILRRGEEIIDSVCWTGREGCMVAFSSANPTTLVWNGTRFEHVAGYEIEYVEGNLVNLESAETDDASGAEAGADENSGGVLSGWCKGVVFSEILSYYEETRDEQFVELYNAGSEQVRLDGCALRYKNKLYELSGIVPAEGYVVVRAGDLGLALTKNPTSANLLELVDRSGVVDKLSYPNGQRKGAAYALVGYDSAGQGIWRVTYAPTPGEANNYQEFRSCAEGKVINEATGNCVKVTEISEKVCPEGQYLNILTGRCRKVATDSDGSAAECKEGYERNPETGRCRKIKKNSGAEYALVPETYSEQSSFVGLYAMLGVLGVGSLYLVWEFRREILRLVRRVFQRFH